MPDWAKQIFSGSIRAIAFWIMVYVILPVGVPILTGWAGYMQGLPWMYIMLGTGVMFAAMSTGLLHFSQWWDRTAVTGKLVFATVRTGRMMSSPNGFCLGLQWHSRASVPIEVQMIEVRTSIGNRVPDQKPYRVTTFTVPPGGMGWFDDHAIDVPDRPKPGHLEGFIDMTIKYGRPGAARHVLRTKKQVAVSFNEAGILQSGAWNDAP
jgi:hypothetical protein